MLVSFVIFYTETKQSDWDRITSGYQVRQVEEDYGKLCLKKYVFTEMEYNASPSQMMKSSITDRTAWHSMSYDMMQDEVTFSL